MKTFPIIEAFVSIQGEGERSGIPSIFIRTSGCNLRCVFGLSICDTPYSSFNPENSSLSYDDVLKLINDNPQIHDIVITGGEPLMHRDGLIDMLNYLGYRVNLLDMCITIETNGTFDPLPEEYETWNIGLYSISPKLKTSVALPGQIINLPNGESIHFSQEQIDNFHKTRRNDRALKMFTDTFSYQFKFVYSGMESYNEIKEYIHEYNIDPKNIMLMPEGLDERILSKHRQEAAEICIKEGWNYTDRLHIIIWGNKRGI